MYENQKASKETQKNQGNIGSGLNDGQWHEVRFLAKENFAVLTIDGDEASAVRTNSPLQVKTGEKYFFGGEMEFSMELIYVDPIMT
ncbi:hypothetical protein DUI87_18600 [Hirundo rustica rustica]|uniref:Laminin G domain-containing protein n=1 Tax=Hirundo rustica rustica TaxID=333673 RepID=A0A3M0JX05_HIRRU|nr:hypothetical protein DUI87_18600 [Hirundo rustica rustica]